jgi:hypothetical protein
MKFSKQFKKKFPKEVSIILKDSNYDTTLDAWESIIYSDDFDDLDLREILDTLQSIDLEKSLLDFNPINDLIYYDKFDQMMFELDKDDIEKYKAYFLSLNSIYTLNIMSEFIISFYGDELNWGVILTNTLYEEVDGESINNYAFDMIANFQEIMFSTEIDNGKYVPAQASLFFKCLELGAEISYNYMRKSIYQDNTTFSHELTKLFQYCLVLMDSDDYSPFVESTLLNSNEELETFKLCIDLIVRRMSFDDELCDFLEKQLSIDEEDSLDNIKPLDDDDDDLGF